MSRPKYGDRVTAKMNIHTHGHKGSVRGVVIGSVIEDRYVGRRPKTTHFAVRGTWGIASFWCDDVKKIKGSKRVYGEKYWAYNDKTGRGYWKVAPL